MIISELLRVAADNGMQGTVGGCGTGLGGSDVAPRVLDDSLYEYEGGGWRHSRWT